jgi:hypothetical protein
MRIDSTLLPVRGNDAVEILENDHQVIKGLLNELVSAFAALDRYRKARRRAYDPQRDRRESRLPRNQ